MAANQAAAQYRTEFESSLRTKYSKLLNLDPPFTRVLDWKPFQRAPELSWPRDATPPNFITLPSIISENLSIQIPDDILHEIFNFLREEIYVCEFALSNCDFDYFALGIDGDTGKLYKYEQDFYLLEFYMSFIPDSVSSAVRPKFELLFSRDDTRWTVLQKVSTIIGLKPKDFVVESRYFRNRISRVFSSSTTSLGDSYNFYPQRDPSSWNYEQQDCQKRAVFDILWKGSQQTLSLKHPGCQKEYFPRVSVRQQSTAHDIQKIAAWIFNIPVLETQLELRSGKVLTEDVWNREIHLRVGGVNTTEIVVRRVARRPG